MRNNKKGNKKNKSIGGKIRRGMWVSEKDDRKERRRSSRRKDYHKKEKY